MAKSLVVQVALQRRDSQHTVLINGLPTSIPKTPDRNLIASQLGNILVTMMENAPNVP